VSASTLPPGRLRRWPTVGAGEEVVVRLHRRGAGSAVLGAALAISLAGNPAHAAGELRIANAGEPETLDPHHVTETWENRIVGDMFMGLTTEAADGSIIAGAAEGWQASDDGLVYTFKLRDHSWSDGVPVTAGDFLFAFRRILDPATAAEYAPLLYTIRNAKAINEGTIEDMDALGVQALDAKTLKITLESPTPYFLEQLTHYTAFPVPKHKVEELGDDWVKPGKIVGNGPYTVVEWVPKDHVRSVRNPAFYDADNVSIDSVTFYPAEDRSAATKRFLAGEIDIQYDFASDQIDWLKENLPRETRIAPYLGVYYYAINTRKAPFDDRGVRQALALAIDREAITDKILRTGERPAYGFVPPGTDAYGEPAHVDWKDTPYPDRLIKAQDLLAAAGFGPERPLRLTLRYNTSDTQKKVAIAVAAMWKQLGIQTELFNSEVKTHYKDMQEGNFQVARAAWLADYNDAQNFLDLMDSESGVLNYAGYGNPEYDRLMAEASKTADPKARTQLLHQAEAIAMTDMPNIPIFYYVSKDLVASSVKGWIDNSKDIHRTRFLRVER
jgi:oligopeptide transport system substrate-binding protein